MPFIKLRQLQKPISKSWFATTGGLYVQRPQRPPSGHSVTGTPETGKGCRSGGKRCGAATADSAGDFVIFPWLPDLSAIDGASPPSASTASAAGADSSTVGSRHAGFRLQMLSSARRQDLG